mgnify:CR=1 FL=1
MYIPIGSDMSIRDSSIIGIFDLDNTTYSKHTRKFLKQVLCPTLCPIGGLK